MWTNAPQVTQRAARTRTASIVSEASVAPVITVTTETHPAAGVRVQTYTYRVGQNVELFIRSKINIQNVAILNILGISLEKSYCTENTN